MHDWTLTEIHFDWKASQAKLDFLDNNSVRVSILVDGVSNLHVPRKNAWGPSVSVNNVVAPIPIGGGEYQMKIEMQSGDTIEICARNFVFPSK